jgi:histidyl-tRNA synthetase
MAKINVSIPQGTRDFGPETVRKRNYIFNTVKNVFELYGFQPLETPAMENLETLTGKYGEEGDKLIFRILNNGLNDPRKEKMLREDFEKLLQGQNAKAITERALRYDLTIPFARFVAMNHGQLSYPFKRYQVQPVWRADKPQQSRYREFYQCDADVVGSHSLLNEVELANIYSTVFELLKIPVEIRINHRKILMALAEICGGDDKLTQITVAIDKLDKLGIEKVKEELAARDLNSSQVNAIEEYLSIAGTNETKLERISSLFHDNENGKKAIADIRFILDFAKNTVTGQGLTLDLTLARGLNYYTGTIFEIKVPNIQIGSIGGGGRYDDLTGLFGVPGVPGVGISFGVDRIYDTMEKLNLFPSEVSTGTQALFFNLGDKESRASFLLMQSLRKEGVRCELYHESSKFDKQFKYAEKKNIPYIIIVGEKELEENNCQVKNIITGKQETIAQKDLIRFTFTS